jgi:hypothetical protein
MLPETDALTLNSDEEVEEPPEETDDDTDE